MQDKTYIGRKIHSKAIGGAIGITPPAISIPNPFVLPGTTTITPIYFGKKHYELTDWLGNVRVVVSDKKVPVNSSTTTIGYKPIISSVTNYYAYGSQIAERTYDPVKPAYRFGFNTQEKVFEITQDHYIAKFWEYDARLGRRWNVDPKPDANYSNYSVLYCNPIKNIDWLGDKPLDDYKIYASGKIERIKTNDKFDRFYYINNEGKETFIGQFDKYIITNKNQEISMIKMPSEGEGFKFVGKEEKQYLRSEVAAGFFGASMHFYAESSRKIYVTQFSNKQGGHSGHAGKGDYIDLLYINKNGNIIELVTTDDVGRFDKEKSQKLVNTFIKFGYDAIPSNNYRGTTRPSIITQGDGLKGIKPALENTFYAPNHYHHIHLQNYNLNKIIDGK